MNLAYIDVVYYVAIHMGIKYCENMYIFKSHLYQDVCMKNGAKILLHFNFLYLLVFCFLKYHLFRN